MSEPKDHNDPEQEMPEVPSKEHIGADVEDDDLQSLLQNHVAEQSSQFQTEVNFINDSRFSGNPLEPDSAKQNIKETAIPSELQTGAEVSISMNQTDKDSEKPGDEVPVSMNQTQNDSEKPGDEITVFMNQTESDSEKTSDEVPAFRNQTQNGSEKTGDELHAFMNQTQSDSEKTGDGGPISLNQTENNSEKTSDEVPFFMNRAENDSERNDALDVKNEMESEMMNTSLDDGSNSLESDVKAAHSENNYSTETPLKKERAEGEQPAPIESSNQSFTFDYFLDGDDSGTEEEQAAFMKELENFFRERSMEFKPPKFYGEGLNCLKLWRAVTKLGGYDRVTSCKLWRQVGESFKPPKTCTTVSWSFRGFYEKALLEYEKHKIRTGELQIPISDLPEAMVIDNQGGVNQASGSGRARRDAAARAMQGWHSQRLLGNGEVGDPIIKDKSSISLLKRDKHLKSNGAHKRKKSSNMEPESKVARIKDIQTQADTTVVDVGAPADWVKINVRQTKDCFEVYALVPGLLREEVQVQSDPAGRLIISGEPEQPDNPWGVTPFKKVITLPSRIDPHQTSAVVTLHGQLFVRAPFDQSDL
ncbi:AT-rich interactive domain-containing protein 6 [Elaeis guineensis]|uniref:AT-rich interactive domain-containing protein 5 n=1 Tax=Elaeis guineensis var. tenera TaxID=51953 RepID=A0A6I9RMG5_ELAGV|nr:AT-rich interactive domain-containing protein 5 [Elaeis guineensis]XP_010928798.1 AT-rich interactive domain-containing protein 5 [Elaeis guineensis]